MFIFRDFQACIPISYIYKVGDDIYPFLNCHYREFVALTAAPVLSTRGQQGPQHAQAPRATKTRATKRAKAAKPPRTPPMMAPTLTVAALLPGSVQDVALVALVPQAAVAAVPA